MTSGSGSDEAQISLKIPYFHHQFCSFNSQLQACTMANGVSLTCTGLLEYGLIAKTSHRNIKWGTRFSSRSSSSSFRVVAVQESEGPRRHYTNHTRCFTQLFQKPVKKGTLWRYLSLGWLLRRPNHLPVVWSFRRQRCYSRGAVCNHHRVCNQSM